MPGGRQYPEVELRPGYHEDYVVEARVAPKWVWDETFNKPNGRLFRVSRIPVDDDTPMREELVHECNLGACVADLAGTAGTCTVLVYEHEEGE